MAYTVLGEMTNLLLALSLALPGSGTNYGDLSQWVSEPSVAVAYAHKVKRPLLVVVVIDDYAFSRLFSVFTERPLATRLRNFVPIFVRSKDMLQRIDPRLQMPVNSSIAAIDYNGKSLGRMSGVFWTPVLTDFMDRAINADRMRSGYEGAVMRWPLINVMNGRDDAEDVESACTLVDRLRFDGHHRQALPVAEKAWKLSHAPNEVFQSGVRYGLALIDVGRFREASAVGEALALNRDFSYEQQAVGLSICRRSGYGQGETLDGKPLQNTSSVRGIASTL